MTESFTCPECGITSYHPKDIQYGYCGKCHAFTGSSPSGEVFHPIWEKGEDTVFHPRLGYVPKEVGLEDTPGEAA